ncbi:hypothetical protein [Pontibacter beigongshangensis]|uniref:hypothetical protein n=1 Tax=Pontibacter beigongshangensis TaxID=2574733 RepID=UPI00164F57D9|nr:hypothetical protein [Pontibacter beigongshangensis]
MEAPRDDDFITNSDESKVVPDDNPEPLEGIKTDEPDKTADNNSGNKSEESSTSQKPAEPQK